MRALLHTSQFLLAAIVCLALFLPGPLLADQTPLLRFSEIAPAHPAPAHAAKAHSIRIDSQGLAAVQQGNSIAIEIANDYVTDFLVTSAHHYINNDRVIQAQTTLEGQSYSLSLTLGPETLYGYLVTAAQAFQIESVRDYDAAGSAYYSGWIYETAGLHPAAARSQHDFLIPDSKTVQQPGTPGTQSALTLPMETSLATGAARSRQASSAAGIAGGDFSLTQTLAPSPVIVGGVVEASVQISNISGVAQNNLGLEIYFFLENSRLASAPAFCREQTSLSLQRVLYCDLGSLAANESRQFSYSFMTDASSGPIVYSSLFMNGLQVDNYIHVVQDVRQDSDGDGISDFNENLLNTDPGNPGSVDNSPTTIDVMAFYTADAAQLYPFGVETRINQLISVANQIYADSGVNITLRPVYHGAVNYPSSHDMDTTLSNLLNGSHAALSSIAGLRAQYGGDLVMLLRPLGAETSRCGLAPVGGFETGGDFTGSSEASLAYSVIGIDCPDDVVVAHELGHNMGLTHSQREDGMGGTFPFATGYGVDNTFATVMALPAAFNTNNRVARFSSPEQTCAGLPCGVTEGNNEPADAVQTLNLVRHQIAAYFDARLPDLPQFTVTSFNGAATSSQIAMAASKDNGFSFTNAVRSNEAVDVMIDLRTDARHTGLSGSVHVLIRTQSGAMFQLDESGRLLRWDGTGTDLRSAVTSGALKSRERITVLQDFRFDKEAVGQEIEFFVAYQYNDFADVIFTAAPLRLRIDP